MQAWGTADHRYFVLIPDQVLAVFKAYRQFSIKAKEAGGVLLGKRRGDNIELCLATAPTTHDQRARSFFTRLPRIHQEIVDRLWVETHGEIAYVGEWHTHPEKEPQPSSIDEGNSMDLIQRHASGDTLLFIIVGTTSLHVQLTSTKVNQVLQLLES